jgi:hypothetical protein
MGLARDLVELEARIRGRPDIDLFAPIAQGGLLRTPECSSVLARIDSMEPTSILRLCLQALRIQHEEMRPRLLDAELVATLPPDTPGLARPTENVMREMIDRTQREIIFWLRADRTRLGHAAGGRSFARGRSNRDLRSQPRRGGAYSRGLAVGYAATEDFLRSRAIGCCPLCLDAREMSAG